MVKLAQSKKAATARKSKKSSPKVVLNSKKTPSMETPLADMSRKELEAEIKRLKVQLLDYHARTDILDPISGLPKRTRFMELASAEFNRTRRYGHDLTLVVAKIAGHSNILEKYGQDAADQVVTTISEICVNSTRYGVDILGRTADNKIAMLLPETNLEGGKLCLDRIRKLVTSMPIQINGETVKVGLHVAARPLKKEHNSFVELLVSA